MAAGASTVEKGPRARRFRKVDRGKLGRWGLSIGLFFVVWEMIGRSGKFLAIVPASEVLPDLWDQLARGRPDPGDTRHALRGGARVPHRRRPRRHVRRDPRGLQALVGRVRPARERVVLGADLDVHPGHRRLLRPRVQGQGGPGRPVQHLRHHHQHRDRHPGGAVVGASRWRGRSRTSRAAACIGGSSSRGRARTSSPGCGSGVGRAVQGAILADLFLRTQNLGLVIRNAAGTFDMRAARDGLLHHDHRRGNDGDRADRRVAAAPMEDAGEP